MKGEGDIVSCYSIKEELFMMDIFSILKYSSDYIPEGIRNNCINMFKIKDSLESLLILHF